MASRLIFTKYQGIFSCMTLSLTCLHILLDLVIVMFRFMTANS